MTNPLKAGLDDIIRQEAIKSVFQPIISLRDGNILGHEALSRITCESQFENIEILFKQAVLHNRLWDLELLCRTIALRTAYVYMIPPYNMKLFLNVDPNVIHDESFKRGFTKNFLDQLDIVPENIIFEITERNIIHDFEGFIQTIDHYKQQNFKIAIDDAGAGYSGLNLISEINPHYVKLDMRLIRNIDTDPLKYALIKGMVEVSKVSSIVLIAEGIETIEELQTLVNLGVQYGQGYLIQRPDEKILTIRTELQNRIRLMNQRKNAMSTYALPNLHIKHLCTFTDTILPSERVETVYDFFKIHPNHIGLCVVENEIPLGIITSENLALRLSGHFGFPLNQHKMISEIMDRNFLKVESHQSIKEVSTLAMARSQQKLYDFIVIVEDDCYVGTVTIRDLLQKSTEMEVTSAKHQNPLSGLPGNLIIEQQLELCLNDTHKRSIAYIDIDHFKAFNDRYGFEKGDMIIKRLAMILCEAFDQQFIGHIGGDDFVIIFDGEAHNDAFESITKRFEQDAHAFYDEADRRNGYILGKNRHGVDEYFPLMSITCVMEINKAQSFENIYTLTKHLADLKSASKQRKLNPVVASFS